MAYHGVGGDQIIAPRGGFKELSAWYFFMGGDAPVAGGTTPRP